MKFVQGARQTGKSTLVRAIRTEAGSRYLTLDDATTLSAARSDPQGFVAGLTGCVAIDEVQRAPELALAIKLAVDRDRRPGQFFLTGSASPLAVPRLAECLAGRMELHTLWPMTQSEFAGSVAGRETMVDRLFAPNLATNMTLPGGRRESWDALAERLLRGGIRRCSGGRTQHDGTRGSVRTS